MLTGLHYHQASLEGHVTYTERGGGGDGAQWSPGKRDNLPCEPLNSFLSDSASVLLRGRGTIFGYAQGSLPVGLGIPYSVPRI